MTKRKPSARVFRLAAELLSIPQNNPIDYEARKELSGNMEASPFCCDNIREAAYHCYGSRGAWDCPELEMFSEVYEKDREDKSDAGWWLLTNGKTQAEQEYDSAHPNWDYESRIYALLLCAEMIWYRQR